MGSSVCFLLKKLSPKAIYWVYIVNPVFVNMELTFRETTSFAQDNTMTDLELKSRSVYFPSLLFFFYSSLSRHQDKS